jgi:ribonuclease HII
MTVLGTRALRRSTRIAALDGFDKQTKTASSIESVGKKPSNERKRQSDEEVAGLPPRKNAPSGLSRSFEQQLWAKGFQAVAGVDEAGRGPLAGPVVAAACIIPDGVNIVGIDDSKKLAAVERESLYAELTSHPDIIWAV